MKKFAPLILFLIYLNVSAQNTVQSEVQKTIEAFFFGFHAKDSSLIKKTVSENVIIQTIGRAKDGSGILMTEDFGEFLRSIESIPDSVDFKERLLSIKIQVDGSMANAWTPYEFWYNGSLSHCGVNSFQLFKDKGEWKIIYLIDTRRKEGCDH
ncbi:nuclear transport factor 2 family protein [Maribacter luteus]|uniref:Nuclear transport factor 2 family protein n=1 Tax=Maribacter luteus TaxID=2594478 RepID=A0A6I2MQN0_9FLAO|nr:nuclear transport factor 2 family protein [Maribacter luteus]MRX65958.1 nuclear transport factor 2 family protein [Maribacter luteus]